MKHFYITFIPFLLTSCNVGQPITETSLEEVDVKEFISTVFERNDKIYSMSSKEYISKIPSKASCHIFGDPGSFHTTVKNDPIFGPTFIKAEGEIDFTFSYSDPQIRELEEGQYVVNGYKNMNIDSATLKGEDIPKDDNELTEWLNTYDPLGFRNVPVFYFFCSSPYPFTFTTEPVSNLLYTFYYNENYFLSENYPSVTLDKDDTYKAKVNGNDTFRLRKAYVIYSDALELGTTMKYYISNSSLRLEYSYLEEGKTIDCAIETNNIGLLKEYDKGEQAYVYTYN